MNNRTSASFTWVYLVALIVAIAVIAIGMMVAMQHGGFALLGVGCGGVMGVLIAWPICAVLRRMHQTSLEHEEQLLTTITDRLQQIAVMLNMISEQQLISDRAKAVAFRENDRDALRRAINEEMAKQDWEAALALASDIENAFGYRQEADRFRQDINGRRQEIIRKQVNEAVSVIDRHTKAEQWTLAMREAERLMRLFPDDDQVRNLPTEIESRRQAYKRQLLDNWNEAVLRHEIDGAIDVLKKLDVYLSPTEAVGIQEAARAVFKEKLNTLRAQFSMAVQNHKWNEAIRVGDVVIREFPNSRAAQEVREKMDALRQRAAEPMAATKL